MKLITSEVPEQFVHVDYILFDIDDTITHEGLLEQESFDTLWELRRAGLHAIPVTGRPAGWCDCIARQWPVSGVIGENGAFIMYMHNGKLERLYNPLAPALEDLQEKLAHLKTKILKKFPEARIAKDQPFRLFDIAFDFAEEEPILDLQFAENIARACEAEGATAKISSIHVNAWFGTYTKRSMAEYVLPELFKVRREDFGQRVMFLGDSPNDEPMFSFFPLSCGVANLMKFKEYIQHYPAYITEAPSGRGFREACRYVLASQNKQAE